MRGTFTYEICCEICSMIQSDYYSADIPSDPRVSSTPAKFNDKIPKAVQDINGWLGMLVFIDDRSTWRDVFRRSWKSQLRDPNGQIAGGCSTGKGCKIKNTLARTLVLPLRTVRVMWPAWSADRQIYLLQNIIRWLTKSVTLTSWRVKACVLDLLFYVLAHDSVKNPLSWTNCTSITGPLKTSFHRQSVQGESELWNIIASFWYDTLRSHSHYRI